MPGASVDAAVCVVCGNDCTILCSHCRAVAYCSRTCQVAHWRGEHWLKCNVFESSSDTETFSVEVSLITQKGTPKPIKQLKKVDALEDLHAEELSRRTILEEMPEKERERCEDLRMLLENALKANEELLANQVVTKFCLSEIEEATYNFDSSSKIEEGAYGSTYKGFLRHTQVAINMMRCDSSLGQSEYHQEVRTASMLRHPNLVTLIGFCPEAWALVCEYLPNGNLEDRLSCRENTVPLSWQTRIQICRDTCAALIFLHSFEPHGISHGDMTPRNILLDANFVAKLSYFGFHDTPFSSRTRGDFSAETDVYSFGMVLLRLLTGRVALNLDEIVQNALMDDALAAALDQTAGQWPLEQAKQLAFLALRCCQVDASNLPDLQSEVWPCLEQFRTLCAQGSSSDHSPGEEHTQPPPYFICPIRHEIMEDPLVAADGYTYEAEEIRAWLSNHDTSPMTSLRLENLNLVSNRIVRSAIQDWRQSNGS